MVFFKNPRGKTRKRVSIMEPPPPQKKNPNFGFWEKGLGMKPF